MNKGKVLSDGELLEIKRSLSAQVEDRMMELDMSKADLRRAMGGGHHMAGRILDGDDVSVTLKTLFFVARCLDMRLRVSFEKE
jgi:hypothetical protein